jgi:hypothetical protein
MIPRGAGGGEGGRARRDGVDPRGHDTPWRWGGRLVWWLHGLVGEECCAAPGRACRRSGPGVGRGVVVRPGPLYNSLWQHMWCSVCCKLGTSRP